MWMHNRKRSDLTAKLSLWHQLGTHQEREHSSGKQCHLSILLCYLVVLSGNSWRSAILKVRSELAFRRLGPGHGTVMPGHSLSSRVQSLEAVLEDMMQRVEAKVVDQLQSEDSREVLMGHADKIFQPLQRSMQQAEQTLEAVGRSITDLTQEKASVHELMDVQNGMHELKQIMTEQYEQSMLTSANVQFGVFKTILSTVGQLQTEVSETLDVLLTAIADPVQGTASIHVAPKAKLKEDMIAVSRDLDVCSMRLQSTLKDAQVMLSAERNWEEQRQSTISQETTESGSTDSESDSGNFALSVASSILSPLQELLRQCRTSTGDLAVGAVSLMKVACPPDWIGVPELPVTLPSAFACTDTAEHGGGWQNTKLPIDVHLHEEIQAAVGRSISDTIVSTEDWATVHSGLDKLNGSSLELHRVLNGLRPFDAALFSAAQSFEPTHVARVFDVTRRCFTGAMVRFPRAVNPRGGHGQTPVRSLRWGSLVA